MSGTTKKPVPERQAETKQTEYTTGMALVSAGNDNCLHADAGERGGMKTIKSPFYQECGLTVSGDRLDHGRKLAIMAKEWMDSHEQAFNQILAYVRRLKRIGSRGRLHDRVSIYCIDKGIQTDTEQYKFSNDVWTGLQRYLVLADPSLKYNPVIVRSSDIDLFGLYPVSYLNIEGGQ